MRLSHPVDYTIETLTGVKDELPSGFGRGYVPADCRDQWLRWWSTADSQLKNLFADGDLAASLYVSAEKVQDVNLGALPLVLLNRESAFWKERFTQLIDELRALKPFIELPGQIVVPDTSAFIEGTYFIELDWQDLIGAAKTEPVRLVVPILVIEELDEHKRGRERVQSRAKSVLRRLWELHADRAGRAALIPGRLVTVEVFGDGQWHARRPVNDDEIIERALAIGEITRREVTLAAADYAMLYRAAAAGLNAVLVPRPDENAASGAGSQVPSTATQTA
jgi:rRNA-processing protein FCF1